LTQPGATATPEGVTPDQAIAEASAGKLRPVVLVLGEERLLVDHVALAIRNATSKGGIAGFNEDRYTAGEASVGTILGAARMAPMMAKRRLVLVRGLERWEKKSDEEESEVEADSAPSPTRKGKVEAGPLDELAEYAKDPSPTTVLCLIATKLHGQRRLVTLAKKAGFLIQCEPVSRDALPRWIEKAARERGNPIPSEVADQLAELAGPSLAHVEGEVERLSLYVGPNNPITEEAVSQVVTRARQSTVWELIDALGERKLAKVLALLDDVFDPRDGGLRLLGAVAWAVRQMVKLESALQTGAEIRDAAQAAGVPPFRAHTVARFVRAAPPGTLARWLAVLAATDRALKGSRRPALAVLETMLIEMCNGAFV
jgi:DNA polymerase-3 subunit delta